MRPVPAPLPPGGRLLHIGPPKTGTTAVQWAFHANRPRLAEQGVVYAGDRARPRDGSRELVHGRAQLGHWQALVDQVAAAGDQRVCLSSESFARADAAQAREAVSALGGPRVHVVLVARPIDAMLPSAWQQRVRKRRRTVSFEHWVDRVLAEDPGKGPAAREHQTFWGVQDLPTLLETWTAAAPGRVTLIVSREGDRSQLPTVFEQLLDLSPGTLATQDTPTNTSFSLAAAELLRRLDHGDAAHTWSRWYFGRRKPSMNRLLRDRPREASEQRILLPERFAERVAELNHRRADVVEEWDRPGVEVVGDPQWLRDRVLTTTTDPDTVQVPVTMAVELLDATMVEQRRREQQLQRRVRRLERRVRELERTRPPAPPGRGPRHVAAGLVARLRRGWRALRRGTPRRDAARPPRG